ncbi:Detected protein of unknown function [Hibiscus syriacus]|uniref:Nuclear pore complex protein NUP214 n=1 Tax=Hibiscus syriacus TaxID=106335 RepID=A0A6A2X9S9_HIBSY|nr:nuclear pore complex protein NUP214 [Hibiscus syriacus]KAE8672042.1 Detected protein of unknown function [Hibiscus syriacus]
MGKQLEIKEEKEGEHVETKDFFFEKIGEPVPVRSDFQFDLQSPPSKPLALSQRLQLLFLAHSSGFLVARTKDVIDLAKDIKENDTSSSIEDLSVVDVPIGKVHILALSTTDDTILAASVAADINFFSVNSLLTKDIKPCFSTSLSGSSVVKDIQWRERKDNSFLVLSDDRKLYHGNISHPLKHVMDDVDAVEWSVKGASVAVAKDNTLSILSSSLTEKLCITLPFKSWVGDSDDCTLKVDTIRWIRSDCIILGCFQFTRDAQEENYLVQVVKSKTGKITDTTSDLVVLSFSDLFAGLIDDIVPFGTGPYLFLSYLEECELAIAANRKNTDQHIVLLGWSLGEMSEASIVDIERDKWLPRIELQDNGEDNLIMGLCIDKASMFGSVKVQLGVEEVKELSPYCVLICLTLEGKLIMFHIASAGENAVPPDISALSDKEENTSAVVSAEFDPPKLTYGQVEQKSELVALSPSFMDKSKTKPLTYGSSGVPIKSDENPSQLNMNSVRHATEQPFHEDDVQSSVSLKNSQSFESVCQQKPPTSKPYQEAGTQQKMFFREQGTNSGQSFLTTSQIEGLDNKVRDGSQTETQTISGFGSIASSVGKVSEDSLQPNHGSIPIKNELIKEPVAKARSVGLQTASVQLWSNPSSQPFSSGKFTLSKESDARGSFSSSSPFQYNSCQSTRGATSFPGGNVGKPSDPKDYTGISVSVDKISATPLDTGAQKSSMGAGIIESVPLIRGSQLSSQLNLAMEKSLKQNLYPLKDDRKSATQSRTSKSEPQIKEMAKELDTLLESIEEPGGFRDACTISQRSSVEELDKGISVLSEKCRSWKNVMDEQHGKLQHLLDKTVEVLARKIYIEGIIKQASDSQYWDLWNCQKLSPEVELKQRHILKLNQELTNQLIELERHFNTFELHKFGDNDGVHASRRALHSRFGPSRHFQSLHSLHSTMSSQLAAAEQLSAHLSQQMAMLSVDSPVKQQNVKELFQMIGITHDASLTSPRATKPSNSSKKFVISSGSSASRNQSRRNQSSALKSSDPEYSRRRRDSLDRSWASFEPPKTTVKRMLLQESADVKGSLIKDKHNFSPNAFEEPKSFFSKELTATSTTLHKSGNEEVKTRSLDALPKQQSESNVFRGDNNPLQPPQSAGWKSSTVQTSNFTALSSTSGSQSMMVQNHSGETCCIPVAKQNFGASQGERSNTSFNENESHASLQFRPNLYQESSVSKVASSPKKSTDVLTSDRKWTVLVNSALGDVKHVPSTTKSTLFGSSNSTNSQFIPQAAFPSSAAPYAEVSQFNTVASKSQLIEKVPQSPAFSKPVSDSSSLFSSSTPSLSSSFSTMPTPSETSITTSINVSSSTATSSTLAPKFSFSTSLSAASTSSPATKFSESTTSSIVSVDDANKKNSSSSSSVPFPAFVSSVSSSIHPFQVPVPLPSDPSPVNSSDVLKIEAQLRKEILGLTKDADSMIQTPPLQHEFPAAELGLKPQFAVSSPMKSVTPTGVSSGSQTSIIDVAGPLTNLASNAQPLQPSAGDNLSAPLSTSISTVDGKSGTLDVTQEDEMEEEAPETSQVAELGLGSLSSFGIGSTTNPTAPKPNPFGASFEVMATSPATSSFTPTVHTGELFKPASFTFQPPQPSQSAQPASFGAFSGGFASSIPGQAPAQGAFGKPAQLGAGQQALGSVLRAFGQSRQLGTALSGSSFASGSSFGGGFASPQSAAGFSNAATGGFAGMTSTTGGFGGLASGGGGFGGLASGGGGSGATGGFAAAATGGGGFGAFGSQPTNAGGFSAFGGGGQTGKPSELFTQMRR